MIHEWLHKRQSVRNDWFVSIILFLFTFVVPWLWLIGFIYLIIFLLMTHVIIHWERGIIK